jgi:hypothetical protein
MVVVRRVAVSPEELPVAVSPEAEWRAVASPEAEQRAVAWPEVELLAAAAQEVEPLAVELPEAAQRAESRAARRTAWARRSPASPEARWCSATMEATI